MFISPTRTVTLNILSDECVDFDSMIYHRVSVSSVKDLSELAKLDDVLLICAVPDAADE
jgi:hypothetical protein